MCVPVFASMTDMMAIVARKKAGGGDYSDITLWWTCESNTIGANDYSAGDTSATLYDGATINASAVKYGTNGLDINNAWDC